MAEMQDVLEDGADIGELETVESQIQQQQAETKEPEPEIPEKYRGKSALDIIKMHQDTERSLSRQGQELGEIRKLADELLRRELQQAKPQESEKPKVDFFENPDEAIKQAVESNPAVLEARRYAAQARQVSAQQQLKQMHPDMGEILSDPDFGKWVGSSPIRQQLFKQADSQFDVMAANELLSTYKELKSMRQQKQSEVESKDREVAMRAAAVDTGGSGESGKKIYRRQDLIRLKIRDPQKYEAMQDEIMAAYTEGRVR